MVIIANIQEDLIKCTCNDNIIEEIEKARNNGFNIKTYWYCNILFSQTGTKLIKSIKPVEVIPVLIIGRSGFYINYYDIKKNKVVNLDFLRLTIGAEIYYLFETKEEAIEEWNRQVEITKDKVQSMYEKTIKYIESKKDKTMRIKDLTDLVHGQNYYIYSLKINNSFGIERIGKIQKVKFIDEKGCENIYHGYGHLLKRGKFILNNRTLDVYGWRYRIFDNYDEAVSEYNKEVLNTLDRLDSFYQEHKKRIKNLLYDRK